MDFAYEYQHTQEELDEMHRTYCLAVLGKKLERMQADGRYPEEVTRLENRIRQLEAAKMKGVG